MTTQAARATPFPTAAIAMPVAILAGGLATRLGPLTQQTPKSLLDVAGQPFIVHQLALLRAAGVTRVVVCVAHLADRIERVVGDGERFGIRVAYSHDALEGTGGALRRALPLLGEQFLVLYGDSYLPVDYRAVAHAFETTVAGGKMRGLMTVFRNAGQYDASNVCFRDGQIVRYDKTPGIGDMTHIDYGLGAFCATAFVPYPDGPLDLVRVYQDLLARDELIGYEVTQRFYEIGSETGLAETRALLSKENS